MGKLKSFHVELENPNGVYYAGQIMNGRLVVELIEEMHMKGKMILITYICMHTCMTTPLLSLSLNFKLPKRAFKVPSFWPIPYFTVEIRLIFKGGAEVYWTETYTSATEGGDTRDNTETFAASETYFNQSVPVYGRGTCTCIIQFAARSLYLYIHIYTS